jgi:hypothetical protein
MQAPNRFCSVEYDTGSYKFLVLNTMKTAGMLATKLVKLKQLPSIWSERQALQAEKEELAQSLACLENVENQLEMAALAASAPADNDASVDSLQYAASTDDGSNTAPAAPALGASVPAHVAAAGGAHNIAASAPVLALTRSSAPAPAPALAELDPAFTLARNVPAASHAPGPSTVSQEPRAFRGVCPACRRDVYTSDKGQVKEGDHYYHQECVKGACTLCSKNVYGDQERGWDGDAYYHIQCPER